MIARIKTLYLVLIFLGLTLFSLSAHATEDKVLRIGIVDPIAPFIISTDRTYSGISIDVWQFIAAQEHLQYQYVVLNMNADAAIQRLTHGDIDVLIGPISVTSDRYKLIDFSYPYFLNSVAIIEHNGASDLSRLFGVFTDMAESPFFIVLILFFLVYAHILWMVEKGRSPNFHMQYRPGMSHILWAHLLQKGFREMPFTMWGRMISLIWCLIAATFVTAVVATVTSKLTLALLARPEHFSRSIDLQDQKVAAIQGTHAFEEADKIGAQVIAVKTLDEGARSLEQRKVAAIAEDYIVAKHFLQTHDYPTIHLSSLALSNDQYAIVVRKNSPLLPRINHQILRMQDNDSTVEMCTRYIGSDAKLCKL